MHFTFTRPDERSSVTCVAALALDLKRGTVNAKPIDIDQAIPAWLWLDIGRNYPDMLKSNDIEIEFEFTADIIIDRSGPEPAYREAENIEYVPNSGTITGEHDSIKLGKDAEIVTDIIGVWDYELRAHAAEEL